MECFLCEKNESNVLMVKLPVEVAYDDATLHIVGNYREEEYMCLVCIGYQIDHQRGVVHW